jgi:hypothetical protein
MGAPPGSMGAPPPRRRPEPPSIPDKDKIMKYLKDNDIKGAHEQLAEQVLKALNKPDLANFLLKGELLDVFDHFKPIQSGGSDNYYKKYLKYKTKYLNALHNN